MADIRSLADLKRAIKPGVLLTFENFRYPEASGERTVVRAQTKDFSTTLPVGHPRADEVSESWLSYPKRELVAFDGRTVTFTRDPKWGDNGPFVKITVPE